MAAKTYKADSMLEALALIQQDLGPDAIVISARETPVRSSWSIFKRKGVEVVAAPAAAMPGTANQSSSRPEAAILQHDPSNGGIAFIEKPAQIEWVEEQEAIPPALPVEESSLTRPIVEDRPLKDRKPRWLPAYISKDNSTLKSIPEKEIGVLLEAPRAEEKETEPAVVCEETPQPKQELEVLVSEEVIPEDVFPKGVETVRTQLLNQGVAESLVEKLTQVALETCDPATLMDEKTSRKYFSQLLVAELRVQQGLSLGVPSRIVCLVGASGGGKTTLAAKLAMFYGHKLEKEVAWICADTLRTGAISEARSYTDAIGIDLKLVYTPADLKEAIANSQYADLMVVDTPGYNPFDERQLVELGSFLTEIQGRFTFLVASAAVKEADLCQMNAALGVFGINGLVITKLDETATFGSVFNFACKSQLPLSYYSSGKEAASNFEIASPDRLVSALFGRAWRK